MEDPIIAARKPCLTRLQKGRRYMWCSCGRSAKQPFCDGSHKGTSFLPVAFTAEEDGEALLCACKHTKRAPFCDGSHNGLSDSYGDVPDGAQTQSVDAVLVPYKTGENGQLSARLDNNCFVVRSADSAASRYGSMCLQPTITDKDGADQLSQFYGTVTDQNAPVIRFAGSDAVIFILAGEGELEIGTQHFSVAKHNGAFVRAGEAFRLCARKGQSLEFNITVCPLGPGPDMLKTMPDVFDESVPNRVEAVDPTKRSAMADRFYQELIDGAKQGTEVTQFIGHIPKSRAPHHKHIYEETITILSGEGYMWTDDTKAEIKAGDTIFLPLKQSHSLEATNDEGMFLIGVFFPSMSPAINY
ncbi:MAG TPA: cupin domain-containing protein [Hellea balneolensis]|uniref:Cupin domain-containing protein n=1 Tax=Hellea balneolensis TaxID=287478 RepID=A0A7C3C193_9PROT|nr:cupin domain-containing protein [Hellea balneolensis]